MVKKKSLIPTDMLFLMHISWYWIKQRPHFLAEHLANYFNITVFSPETFRGNKQLIITEKPSFVRFFKILPLRRLRRLNIYRKTNDTFIRWQIKNHFKKSKYIWFTTPLDYLIFKKYINQSQIVIYDCMDDFLEFPSIKSCSNLISTYFIAEQELLKRANVIFASSQYLKGKLQTRHNITSEIFIINNAISTTLFEHNYNKSEVAYPESNGYTDLIYIGTISHWLNFDLLLESLKHFNQIRYILIGPTERDIPIHNRIIHLGLKKHNEVQAYMQKANALIMPFIVNDLIESVSPVKLYEYIFSGKPVITCGYSEIDQFDDFVYRYNSDIEYFNLLNKLINKELKQKHLDLCRQFAMQNTWEKRVEIIKSTFNSQTLKL